MSDQSEAMTPDLLGRLVREIQAEQRAARGQRREKVAVLCALVDQMDRVDRRIAELRDPRRMWQRRPSG